MSAILRWVIIISIYLFIFTSKVFATFPIFPISFCILNRLTGRLISYTLMHSRCLHRYCRTSSILPNRFSCSSALYPVLILTQQH